VSPSTYSEGYQLVKKGGQMNCSARPGDGDGVFVGGNIVREYRMLSIPLS
jgi:hypothetical protein